MINLLPDEEKKAILSEQKKKMTIIIWVLVLIFFFSLSLSLFLIKGRLQSQLENQKKILLESEERLKQAGVIEIKGKINLANSTLTKLNSFYKKKVYFGDILAKIAEIIPDDLYLKYLSISLSGENNSEVNIILSGFAPTREILFKLKKNFEEDNYFSIVSFPPSNWVKPTDIDFSANLKIVKTSNKK